MRAIACSAAATSIRHDGAKRKQRPSSPVGAVNAGIKVSGVCKILYRGPPASAKLSRVALIVAEGMGFEPTIRLLTV
jgi:hypothetical protein